MRHPQILCQLPRIISVPAFLFTRSSIVAFVAAVISLIRERSTMDKRNL